MRRLANVSDQKCRDDSDDDALADEQVLGVLVDSPALVIVILSVQRWVTYLEVEI